MLFEIGHRMDAAGIEWTILSGFRDDFRQKMASGLKAHVNNSFHGGSAATGGYGHGCAVDIASADRLADFAVWKWVDKNGRDFALCRLGVQLTPFRTRGPIRTAFCGKPRGLDRDDYYCSELVTEACVYAGLLDGRTMRPAATYPRDIFMDHSLNPWLNKHLKTPPLYV